MRRIPILYFCAILLVACTQGAPPRGQSGDSSDRELFARQQQNIQRALSDLQRAFSDLVCSILFADCQRGGAGGQRRTYDDESNERRNAQNFAAAVWRSVQSYYQYHRHYPAMLSDIEIASDPVARRFLGACRYEIAPRGFGVNLDCRLANVMFMENYVANGEGASYIDPGSRVIDPPRPPPPPVRTLSILPRANTTWGASLNPGGEAPLDGRWQAYYINTKRPAEVVYSENTGLVAAKYAWREFHNIPSEDFGAYWVADVNIPKTATYTFSVDQSWSKTRIIVDGYVVFEGGQGGAGDVELPAGRHRFEVEHINNWHTVEFRMHYAPVVQYIGAGALKEAVARLDEAAVYYVHVDKSAGRSNRVRIDLAPGGALVALYLDSQHPVHWVLGAGRERVSAVFYGARRRGSSIGNNPGDTYALSDSLGFIDEDPTCHCMPTIFHCNNDGDLDAFVKRFRMQTGRRLSGFTSMRTVSSVSVPQVLVDDEALAASVARNKRVEEQRQACMADKPDFERMMRRDH